MSGCTKNRMLSAIIYPFPGYMILTAGINKYITIGDWTTAKEEQPASRRQTESWQKANRKLAEGKQPTSAIEASRLFLYNSLPDILSLISREARLAGISQSALHSSPFQYKELKHNILNRWRAFRHSSPTLHHSSPFTSKRLRVYTLHNSKKSSNSWLN